MLLPAGLYRVVVLGVLGLVALAIAGQVGLKAFQSSTLPILDDVIKMGLTGLLGLLVVPARVMQESSSATGRTAPPSGPPSAP
jgi:hypothetical protein